MLDVKSRFIILIRIIRQASETLKLCTYNLIVQESSVMYTTRSEGVTTMKGSSFTPQPEFLRILNQQLQPPCYELHQVSYTAIRRDLEIQGQRSGCATDSQGGVSVI